MTDPNCKALAASYSTARADAANWQLVTSVGFYLAMWAVLPWAVAFSWWLALPLAVLAGGLLVRVFIVFHDCGHGSFFTSPAANRFWGVLTGVLTWTPYEHWRGMHAIHHGTTGNLDKRGVGDVWTMTVREYREAGWWHRCAYRFLRDPFVLLCVAPLAMFVLGHRVSKKRANPRERRSVWFTTLGIAVWCVLMSAIVGILPFVILQLVILAVAGAIGVWLFYTQHQFDGAYWQRSDDWDFEVAAIQGSSYLKLPRLLQWFTGNIGFHHIHHLNSRIPNYNLQACHDAVERIQQVAPLTLLRSLGAFRLKLWDEATGRMVRFRHARRSGAA